MTARGRAVLALGIFCWIPAIVFGSPALYPVAAGLVIVVALAVAWVRLTGRQPRVRRSWRHETVVERGEVRIELVLEREPGLPLPNVVAHDARREIAIGGDLAGQSEHRTAGRGEKHTA